MSGGPYLLVYDTEYVNKTYEIFEDNLLKLLDKTAAMYYHKLNLKVEAKTIMEEEQQHQHHRPASILGFDKSFFFFSFCYNL